MKSIKILLAAAFVTASSLAFAGTPETSKDAKPETVAIPSESTLETKDFYVDDNGARINIEYPTMGDCASDETENCHATYTRQSPTSPWVLQGAIQKGLKPF